MFFGQFYEKWVSVRERIIKMLLETVTYLTITETVTSIIALETVMCIMCNFLSQWVYTGRICLIMLYFQRQEIATIGKYRLSLI